MQLRREAVGGLIADAEKERGSGGVTNAPALGQLIAPVDVLPSSWIHTKHEKGIMNGSFTESKQTALAASALALHS